MSSVKCKILVCITVNLCSVQVYSGKCVSVQVYSVYSV